MFESHHPDQGLDSYFELPDEFCVRTCFAWLDSPENAELAFQKVFSLLEISGKTGRIEL